MSRIRKATVLALVALGLVALAAPAGASAQTSKQTKADIKRLGENVNELRKKTDEMNRTISSLATVAGNALTQLQAGLVKLADTTADFKYAVVQVGMASGGSGDGIAGLGPTQFYATPPIYKIGAQSTVTFAVPERVVAGPTPLNLRLFTAVRSLNPDSGSVECRVTIAPEGDGAGAGNFTAQRSTKSNGAGGYFHKMPQSRIQPQNGDASFPLALVATEDNAVNLADPGLLNAGGSVGGLVSGVGTLSCLRTS